MTPFFRADLHCHSTCSDGSLSPTELILRGKERGLQALSITDHDTTEAYATALPAAKDAGMLLLSGAEFSTVYCGNSIHLLAYAYPFNAPSILQLCQRHRQRREERNLAILEKLNAHGLSITYDDVMAEARPGTMLGRPHIALAMMRKGYIPGVREAFFLHIGDTAPCFAQGQPISTEETIEAIHAANAYAVLAHPHLVSPSSLVKQVLSLPFDGIEGYYGNFGISQNARWLTLAKKRGLLITGGSDFHGAIKPNIELGCSWAPEETFKILYTRFKENNP